MNKCFLTILTTLALFAGSAIEASDFELGAYVRLPFGAGDPVFGVSAKPTLREFSEHESGAPGGDDAGLHLQVTTKQAPVVMLNGMAMTQPSWLNQDADGKSAENQTIDWYTVAAVAVGVGLIAIVANADDVTIAACSGPNCPPDKPNPEPEPAPSEGG